MLSAPQTKAGGDEYTLPSSSLTLNSTCPKTDSSPVIFWPSLYCDVKLQGWPVAQVSGMKLSLGISPARPPASSSHNPSQWMQSSLPPTLSLPHFFFFGFKGYLQPSCLGPLARVWESSLFATGVSAADKRREALRGGGGQGAGQRVAQRYGGPSRLWTDLHSQYCMQMDSFRNEKTKEDRFTYLIPNVAFSKNEGVSVWLWCRLNEWLYCTCCVQNKVFIMFYSGEQRTQTWVEHVFLKGCTNVRDYDRG